MELVLDKATHTYWRGPQEVRGVSRVLEASGLKERFYGRGAALELGKAVHELTEHMDWGETDLNVYHPQVLLFGPCWTAARTHLDFEILQIETPLYSALHDYAGTPDRVVMIRSRGRKVRGIIEIKTGQSYPWHVFQTAAYAHLAEAVARITVYLDPALPLGFKIEEHKDSWHWQKFAAALVTTQGQIPLQRRVA